MQEEIVGNYKDIRAVMGQQTGVIDKLELRDIYKQLFLII